MDEAGAESLPAYAGVGFRFTRQPDKQFVVDYAFGGSPAERAGIRSGDVLLAVDGRSLAGMTAEEAAGLIRGPFGTTVGLTLLRAAAETLSFQVERRSITIPDRLYPAPTRSGYGFTDRQGSMFIPPYYASAGYFSEGLAAVTRDGKAGYIDHTGASAEGVKFDKAFGFSGGYGVVKLDGRCWFVGRDGKRLKAGSDSAGFGGNIWRCSEGRALLMAGSGARVKYGFLDTAGFLAIDTVYAWADDFSEGLAPAKDAGTGRLGYLGRDGEWAIEPQFTEASKFSCGRAFVRAGGKAGFISHSGRMVIESGDRLYLPFFSEGLAVFGRNDRFGYADTTGRIAVEARYDDAGSFSDGMAWVRVGEKCGYIDRQGNMAIQPRFAMDDVGDFRDGLARVKHDGKNQYIDKTGKVVWREP
jgi:hypothetical protein